jgi:thiol-disulfide isomerase/thioredoxin
MKQKAVQGINYVRPPELQFTIKKETNDFIDYEIETLKDAKEQSSDNVYTKNIDSLIYCNDKINIKMPKPEFMKDKNGNSKFAYAFGMFPNPKNGKAAYLDGCILGALGLKRQQTGADVICFITHDISEKDKQKLEIVFDKVMYVPYISPYDMGGEGDLKTIMMDAKIFKNCPNYTKKHPYSHVFFKLHIFNPKLFPYEKVCFVDSDLVPMNFYDSLFMLDTPAGWVEYRKKLPYLESFHWDRCDFLKHGQKIPQIFTDIDTPAGADVNAGLMVVKPDKKEYDQMIKELTSPLKTWMGQDKYHKGFYSFDFDSLSGNKFIKDSYCYPEQNYLTKRYSGKWTYVEFSFQSWTLDPCNSFGIHMAAFNPKPWFKQPAGMKLNIKDKLKDPYATDPYAKDDQLTDLPKAFVGEELESYYENIAYSYEIFNDLIVWGLIEYRGLKDFFVNEMEIKGPKISFDRDDFKPLSRDIDSIFIKDIKIGTKEYRKLSISQKYICNLLNEYDKYYDKIKDNYLNVCLKKKVNRYGEKSQDLTIVTWPDYGLNKKLKSGSKKKTKRKPKKTKRTKRKNGRNKKRSKKKETSTIEYQSGGQPSEKWNCEIEPEELNELTGPVIIAFYAPWCGYCKKLKPQYEQSARKNESMIKAIDCAKHKSVAQNYGISGFPTIKYWTDGKISPGTGEDYRGGRNTENFDNFCKDLKQPGKVQKMKSLLNKMKGPGQQIQRHIRGAQRAGGAAESRWNCEIEPAELDKLTGPVIIAFYAPWCGFCKKLKPDLERAHGHMDKSPFKAINCDKHKDVAQKYGISGYPTIKYWTDGEISPGTGSLYKNERTSDQLHQFATSLM